MMKKTKISIIIPAYNEEDRLEEPLRKYADFFKERGEVWVILNGCRDNTIGVVKKVREDYPNIKYEIYEDAIGKGGALIEGFKLAQTDYIGFVDADAATSPESFNDLLENIEDFDGIIASRYIKGAEILTPQPLSRRVASRIFNMLVRGLFRMKYKDTQCGAKIFKKEALKSVVDKMKETGWALDVELLYLMKKKKFRVKEHPTVWQEPGESRLRLKKVGPKMFIALLKLRFRT